MSPLLKRLQNNSRNLKYVLSKRMNTVQYIQCITTIKEFTFGG